MPGGRDALLARVDRDLAGCVEHGDLAHLGVRIRSPECGERLFGRLAAPHQLEPERPVASLAVGLRRHHADARLGPGHDGARPEGARLHRGSELAALLVPRDDRVRQPSRPRSQASTWAAFSSGGKTG